MRIIAMSDSHGNICALEKIFEKTAGSGDIFVHLGDGEKELEHMRMKYPRLDIRHVAGNCDYGSMSPLISVVSAEKANILCTHGHRYGVKYDIRTLCSIARDNDCKVVLFGHTHCRFQGYEDGIFIMNPGSCSCPRDFNTPSYGWVDITESGIITNITQI